MKVAIGIDLGGTNVKGILMREDGEILNGSTIRPHQTSTVRLASDCRKIIRADWRAAFECQILATPPKDQCAYCSVRSVCAVLATLERPRLGRVSTVG